MRDHISQIDPLLLPYGLVSRLDMNAIIIRTQAKFTDLWLGHAVWAFIGYDHSCTDGESHKEVMLEGSSEEDFPTR